MINVKELRNPDVFKEKHIVSLARLKEMVDFAIHNCELNKQDLSKIPVVIRDRIAQEEYLLHSCAVRFEKGWSVSLGFFGDDRNRIDYFEGEDKQPEGGGEFWQSRGPSQWDCSGFVVSKQAGERLLELTRLALGRVIIKSFLDWRKHEPNWIQFKFSAEEFDVEKLDKMARENDNVLTQEILEQCIKPYSPSEK